MSKTNSTTMSAIRAGQLFICPDVGVLRRTDHPMIAEDKSGKRRVIYPNEQVMLLKKREAK